jgi:glycosyltransferase involved in cell wall biosynthesis
MEATIGGTRRHIVDVARGQLALGLQVHLAVSAERQPNFRADLARLAAEGVLVEQVPMVREIAPRRDLAHLRALEKLLRARTPDVVHTHSSKAGALGRRASLATGIGARVHTPHTFAFLFEALFSPAKRRLYRAVEGYLGRRTDRMIAVSAEEGETIRASGVCDPQRVRVVPNGIDPARALAAPLARSSLGIPAHAPLAAVVGLLYEAKGQDLALEALARPECAGLYLAFAGEGQRRTEYEALAQSLGVAERARFLGWRDDVPALLAASDFLCLPSRWEGLPYIVLEAFAAGKPVVAARVDGTRALVLDGETGYGAAVANVADLARALAQMLAEPPERRARMGARGRELVLSSYTVESMVRGLAAVYGELG